ncbi:MAG: FKBP-type peptidyl-prolyl cis-trans isomerase [Ignavibacteriae bacterium]|nr:FKBP-type peptidyl-prolyl cis-trans isomerase [Ignavibacteriota bacterium]MCB9206506.1 FKBP-type peptidyl-prolyl cis-trans isomerase [Ignavibacteriales bacterium]MCB9211208.1 FKBP-type peptidyl-prolyl cis-trans isomerase [Ignavibacteriales bacterium]MCB9219429.1 FKBP-type peptidyl-prolyl cis-trans isomerase [Ignavibacteriales bacterium]MCB9259897.1 FKBP-type peptidyl-prolyl cis-trans isomerase [Ignavibacteriales bacterium]
MEYEKHARVGDLVTLKFKGKLEDGTLFDQSKENEPLKFKIGSGEVIQGIDEAVVGMKINQDKVIHISSDKAYGAIEKELVIEISKDEIPTDMEIELNQEIQIPNGDGDSINVRITKITNNTIELDGNHPLAGKNLIFELKLLDII